VTRMELIAGDARDILTAIGALELGGRLDPARFPALLPLGGSVDPTWLDLFAEAARSCVEDGPGDFLDARIELGAPDLGALSVERVDPSWISAVARFPGDQLHALAGRWIDRLEEEIGPIPGEEKPWIRELAESIVAFCRSADQGHDVVFAWSLR
jgi:hypothetical protein